MVEVDQHHHAGLGGNAGERDEPDRHRHRQVEPEPPHQPQPAHQGERQRQHDDERLGEAAEVEVEQQEDDHQRHRHHHLQAGFGALEVFELAAPDQVGAGRELHLLGHRLLRVGDVAAEVAVADVDEDVGGELGVLGADAGGALREPDVGDLAQGHRAAAVAAPPARPWRWIAGRSADRADSGWPPCSVRGLRRWW